jgi:hypothetical protein
MRVIEQRKRIISNKLVAPVFEVEVEVEVEVDLDVAAAFDTEFR